MTADLSAGKAARDAGAALALDAEQDIWKANAAEALDKLAATGRPFSALDIERLVGLPPGHPNAMGGLFVGAVSRGLIEPVGFRQSSRVAAHARTIRVWVGRDAAAVA